MFDSYYPDMENNNKKKSKQLGMNYSTAMSRLRKLILFQLVQETRRNKCFRCKNLIENIEELSIEHKKPWLDNSIELFWKLDNIEFSHLKCNTGAGKKFKKYKSDKERKSASNKRYYIKMKLEPGMIRYKKWRGLSW